MNSEAQIKQPVGQIKSLRGRTIDDDLLSLDGDSEHFGAWSRNAMVPIRSKSKIKAKNRHSDESQSRH